jgi:hypothetical protein
VKECRDALFETMLLVLIICYDWTMRWMYCTFIIATYLNLRGAYGRRLRRVSITSCVVSHETHEHFGVPICDIHV